MADDPFIRFTAWFEQAREQEPSDHDAVALGSVDANGRPSIRMVLMRAYDTRGFIFYTNLKSRKAVDYRENSAAAMCFHWKSTARQVRIEGTVEAVDDATADTYFASRPRESQLGAWASDQSSPLTSRDLLLARLEERTQAFEGQAIARPEFWSGYRLVPDQFEFWDKRAHRLHDRVQFLHDGTRWRSQLLFP